MSPRLSVVVPLVSTEPRLQHCLRTLAAQTVDDLEVVLVDDGAADPEAAAAAHERAAADDRFRVVTAEGLPATHPGRLGRARAEGLRHLSPDSAYLAFLDPDDAVPATAYARMIASMEETGSDFATGNVVRLGPSGPGSTPLLGKPLDRDRPASHVTRLRNLTRDRLAGNKVFRRDFWEKHALRWEEDAGEADLRLVVPAHFLAGAVDVLAEPVLHRRPAGDTGPERTGLATPPPRGPSASVKLREQIAALDSVSRFLADRGAAAPGPGGADGSAGWAADRNVDKRHFDTSVLTTDLAPYVTALPEADEAFRHEFVELAADYAARVAPAAVAALPLPGRATWHLIRERRAADLLALLAYERDNPRVFPVARRGRRRVAAYPGPNGDTIALPSDIARVRPGEQPLHARLQEARWRPDGTLLLRGYAYVRSADAGRPHRAPKFGWLRQDGSRKRLPLRVRTAEAPEATRYSRQRTYSYDASGFEMTVDPRRLLAALRGGRRDGTWTLCLGVVAGSLIRVGGVQAGGEGSGAQPPVRDLPDGRRLSVTFGAGRLRLAVEDVTARLVEHRVVGDALELSVDVRAPHQPVTLHVTHQRTGRELDHPVEVAAEATDGPSARADGPDWCRCTVRVPLRELTENREEVPDEEHGTDESRPRGHDRWRAALTLADDSTCRIAVPADFDPLRTPLGQDPALGGAPRELYSAPDPFGTLQLSDRTLQAVAERLSWDDHGRLTLEGTLPEEAPEDVEVIWQHSGHRQEVAAPVERSGHRFTTRLRPSEASPGGLPLRQGNWYPFFRARLAETRERDVPVRLLPGLLETLPRRYESPGASPRAFTVTRRHHDRIFLKSGSDLAPVERGAYGQHRLSTVHYPAARKLPLRDAVLYQSFDGRQYSDSPRAVHEELVRRGTEVEHLWAVRDGQALVPPTAKTVIMGSAEWYEALARSRWLVGNTHFPQWFTRREGQTVVQTWHGTPLKRIGHDLADTAFANRTYLAGLTARAAEWSVLVSPNRFSTPVLSRAFGYDGEVLESGYPRNDLLYAEDREERAELVRSRLGIPAGKRVVLYAPTWRDDNRYDRSNCKFDLRLDLAAARTALGADTVLLVRKHYLVADSVPGTGDGFVTDVSAYPDLAELLLIADVLITDYSSLMFDFAHTGRPMLFYTYDLDHYRDVLRGFYFDFEQRAPGPLLSTSDELIEALRKTDAVAEAHREAYADFRRAFCDLDDGTAAARVVERMLRQA